MIEAERIISLLKERKQAAGPMVSAMEEVRRVYNGEWALPMPEVNADERPAVANLTQQAVDQIGMRIASTNPSIYFPPSRSSSAEQKRSRKRKDVTVGWRTERNKTGLQMRRRARWFVAYTHAPVLIRPDAEGLPIWQARNPLTSFPAPGTDRDELVAPDHIFTYRRGRASLEGDYPEEMRVLRKREQTMFEVLEYVDGEEFVVLVQGVANDTYSTITGDGHLPHVELCRLPNRAGVPWAVAPGRITLDRPMGAYDGIIGIYQTQAKLQALQLIGQERAIFPEMWLVSQGPGQAEVVVDADPKRGIMGQVSGGSIEKIQPDPSALTSGSLAALEYAQRMGGGIPASFGGQGPTNVRTGRALGGIMDATIEFPIQEAQECFAESMRAENKIAIAIAKAYGGSKTFSMYVSRRGEIDYNPVELFPKGSENHEVNYAYAGTDANSLTIAGGQRIGMTTMSHERFMEIDPMIIDVEVEKQRIRVEAIEQAGLTSVQTLASQPDGPWQPIDFANLGKKLIEQDMNFFEAVEAVHQDVQKAQAAAQQPQGPPGAEQMPGLSTPGQPGAMGPIPDQFDSPSAHLSMLLNNLRHPQRATVAERQPVGAP
jgi:hypothetical protein